MDSKKNLLILVGKASLIEDFKKKYEEYFDENTSMNLKTLKSLDEQLSFIMSEERFEHIINVFLELETLDNSDLSYIKEVSDKYDNIHHKFLFLFDEEEKMDQDIPKLPTKKIKKGGLDNRLANIASKNNMLMLNIDTLNYYIEVVKVYYDVGSVDDIPTEIRSLIEGSFVILGDKIQEESGNI